MKMIQKALLIAFFIGFSQPSFAGATKDYYLNPANGSALSYSDISLAVRSIFEGARPRVTKRYSPFGSDCHHVKFLYKNELKRVSFNCTGSKIILSPETLSKKAIPEAIQASKAANSIVV